MSRNELLQFLAAGAYKRRLYDKLLAFISNGASRNTYLIVSLHGLHEHMPWQYCLPRLRAVCLTPLAELNRFTTFNTTFLPTLGDELVQVRLK